MRIVRPWKYEQLINAKGVVMDIHDGLTVEQKESLDFLFSHKEEETKEIPSSKSIAPGPFAFITCKHCFRYKALGGLCVIKGHVLNCLKCESYRGE